MSAPTMPPEVPYVHYLTREEVVDVGNVRDPDWMFASHAMA
jgi:hypothetical protein